MSQAAEKQEWHGTYLDEDGIVADVLAKVRADPEAVKRWIDDDSWHMPIGKGGKVKEGVPEYAGCLMFAGMSIRNYYGLWHPECPYTENGKPLVENGIITDERFADNLSGRVIDRVRAALREDVESSAG